MPINLFFQRKEISMKRFIRIVSGILIMLMVMSLFPISVIATDTQNTYTVQFDLNYNGAHVSKPV